MAGVWDSIMKRLVKAYAKHFTKWLMADATFVRSLDIELKSQHLFADALLDIVSYDVPALLHIEFQTYRDPELGKRLLEYSILASREYGGRPVYSYAIYLRRMSGVAKSPYTRELPDGEVAYNFYFRVIKMWEVPAETILGPGWMGLLPLVTLAKGGKRPEVVNDMIDRLAVAEEYDLLAAARLVGGLVFKEGSKEGDWFKGRFHMYQDILRESWVYQEIGKEYFEQGVTKGIEQGVEKGREEERQRRVQEQQQMLKRLVQSRFPELLALAQQQAYSIKDPELLVTTNFKLLNAQNIEEARQLLLSLDKSNNSH